MLAHKSPSQHPSAEAWAGSPITDSLPKDADGSTTMMPSQRMTFTAAFAGIVPGCPPPIGPGDQVNIRAPEQQVISAEVDALLAGGQAGGEHRRLRRARRWSSENGA